MSYTYERLVWQNSLFQWNRKQTNNDTRTLTKTHPNDCDFFDRTLQKHQLKNVNAWANDVQQRATDAISIEWFHGRGIHRIPLIQPQKENNTFNNSQLLAARKEYQATRCSMSMFTAVSKLTFEWAEKKEEKCKAHTHTHKIDRYTKSHNTR